MRASWMPWILAAAAACSPSAAAREPEPIEIGSAIEGVLDGDDPVLEGKGRCRSFRLTASNSGKITIDLESRQFNACVLVRDGAGAAIAEDDDGGPGDCARVVLEAEEGKEYTILAAGRGPRESGGFRLGVREGEPEALTHGDELVRDLAWYEETATLEIPLPRRGDILNRIGRCHLELGRPDRAKEFLERSLAISRETQDRPGEGRALGGLGIAHADTGQFEKAIEFYGEALLIHREIGDLEGEAVLLGNLGILRRRLGDPERAIEHYEDALAIFRKIKDPRREGIVLGNLGNAHNQCGRPRKAIECYEAALEIHRKIRNRRSEGITLEHLGNACCDLGQARRAIEYYEGALLIHREVKNRRYEGSCLKSLGDAYRGLGRLERAIEHYRAALEIHRETKNRQGEGMVLVGFGNVYGELGELELAIEYYNNALEILREGKDRLNEGITLGNLGNRYRDLGQLERAIEYYDEALRIHRETLDRRSEGRVLGNIGIIYRQLGQPERALEQYEKALEIHRQTEDRSGEGGVLNSIGCIFGDMGEPEHAIDRYERALEIHREIADPKSEALILGNIGNQLGNLGQPEKAIEYNEKALKIHRETRNLLGEGDVLGNLGSAHAKVGQLEEAVDCYEEALRIHRVASNRRKEALIQWNLGKLHVLRGDEASAHRAFRAAYALEMEILGGVERRFEESAVQSLATLAFQRGVADYFKLLVRLYRNAGSSEEQDRLLEEALKVVESIRARTLAKSLQFGDVASLLSPEGREAWNRLQAYKEKISDLVKAAFEALPEEEEARKGVLAKLQGDCRQCEEEAASLERKLKASERKFARLFSTGATNPMKISDLLGPKEILLHFNIVGKEVAVFILGPGQGRELRTLEIDSEALRSGIQKALLEIRPQKGSPGEVSVLKPELRALRRVLLQGMEERLEGVEEVVIVPDGWLHLFPFEALVLEDGRFLVERFRVRYAPSIQVLLGLMGRAQIEARSKLVLFGDPDFGASLPEGGEPALALRVRGAEEFRRLRHASEEISRIGDLFEDKLVRKGAEATEAAFREECHRGSMLHIATHGRFAQSAGPDGQPLFYSGLAFSGCNRGGDGRENGFLTAAEVMALDLRAVDLVVLSACETAVGAVRPHEGKFGLERAFIIAGAGTFVGSLWQVDDQAAAEFMERFYRYLLAGEGKSEALRLTKLDFILREGGPRADPAAPGERGVGLAPVPARNWAHPYYWAPFVLSGRP